MKTEKEVNEEIFRLEEFLKRDRPHTFGFVSEMDLNAIREIKNALLWVVDRNA